MDQSSRCHLHTHHELQKKRKYGDHVCKMHTTVTDNVHPRNIQGTCSIFYRFSNASPEMSLTSGPRDF